MIADVPAGLGYLAGSLAAGAVEIALVSNRKRYARRILAYYAARAARTSPRWRWLHGTFARKKWQDEEFRERSLFTAWGPPIFAMAIISLLLLASAVAEFS